MLDDSGDSDYSNNSEASDDEFITQTKTQTRTRKCKYNWISDTFIPQIHPFDPSDSGFKVTFSDDMNEMSFFKVFINADIVDNIVKCTNKNYNNIKNNTSEKLHRWSDTNIDELYTFMALSMLESRNSHSTLGENWSTDVLFHSPIFSETMSRNRFRLLARLLYFRDEYVPESDNNLFPIESFIQLLQKKFSDIIYPYQNLCVENSHHIFKGRSSLHSHIPNKRFHYGIKLFTIRDCETGFILNFVLKNFLKTYAEKTRIRNFNLSGDDIVMSLCTPYLQRGHTLYVDVWFANPTIFNRLHMYKTNACGITRRTKFNLPKLNRELKKGDSICYYTDAVMAHTWIHKNEMTMLTTLHTSDFCETDKRNRKTKELISLPYSALDYKNNVDRINKSEMLISSIDFIRRTIQCYKKVFFHLVDLCLYNAYILFRHNTGKTITLEEFQANVISQLISTHLKKEVRRKCRFIELPSTPQDRHFLGHMPTLANGSIARRQCTVCVKTEDKKKRRDTKYMCKQCNIALCAVPCFEQYHIKKLKL